MADREAVIVVVEGGVVQSVGTTLDSIDVYVVDYDDAYEDKEYAAGQEWGEDISGWPTDDGSALALIRGDDGHHPAISRCIEPVTLPGKRWPCPCRQPGRKEDTPCPTTSGS